MDAPPDTCGSQARFVEIATHIRQLDLCAPDVYAWDENLGILVLEDLGQTDFAQHLTNHSVDEQLLYEAAVDVLALLQSSPPPDGLNKMTPQVGADMIDIAFEWAAVDQSPELAAQIKSHIYDGLTKADSTPNTLSLRDFHAENLIWRPHQDGTARVGLLDFQDAFVTHPTYDLASLLRDARRDLTPSLVDPLVTRLTPSGSDPIAFKNAFHIMAVQRNLRILGIFARLAKLDGKSKYLALIPRVWSHLMRDLATPNLAPLLPLVQRAFYPAGGK